METAPKSRGAVRKLAAIAVVAILLASLGAYEYTRAASLQSESRLLAASLSADQSTINSLGSQLRNGSSAVASLETQVSSLGSQDNAMSSPCAQKPPHPTETGDKLKPNGTGLVGIVQFSYPIFTLQPGSIGTFCATYENQSPNSTKFDGAFHAYDWNSSVEPAGVSIFANATEFTVPAEQNATVAYAVEATTSTAEYLGVGKNNNTCFDLFQLAVSSSRPSQPTFSSFPGLQELVFPASSPNAILDCQTDFGPDWVFTGFNGFGIVDLHSTLDLRLGYNVTSRYITSTVQSPTRQNITISVGIRSYATALTLTFDPSTIRAFYTNPMVVPTPGDPCDWVLTNRTALYTMAQDSALTFPGFTVDAPPVHVAPFSNGTFRFSMEVNDTAPDYYLTYLGFAVQFENGTGITGNYNEVALTTYFPINAGSGQLDQNMTGTCPPLDGGPGQATNPG
jgi:hypothetical protein